MRSTSEKSQGVDTKKEITEQQNYKTVKQQKQNSDFDKTAKTTKQQTL